MSDPILRQVRRTRREIEAEHGNDWKALEQHFTDKQENSPEEKVTGKPKRLPEKRKAV